MSLRRALFLSFLATVALWAVFSWPLPRYVFSGVPTSSRNIELGNVRSMMPSDQLQLMYHYWLAKDMIAGETPPFHNLYEFNAGDDEDRLWPTVYFFPISVIFAAASALGGNAFGMNVAGIVSLWLTLFLTWLLARRYTEEPWLAEAVSVLAIALPYRWASQLGGSPGGYAMVYVPMCFLGLDIAVRDRTWKGGVLAGAGILLACWGDVQVFFFTGLALPAWCIIAAFRAGEPRPFSGRSLWTSFIALLPVLIFIAIAFIYRAALSPFLAESMLSGGRSPEEVALFAPQANGLWSWENLGIGNHIYFGYALAALLAACIASLLLRRRASVREWVPFVLIVVCVLVAVAIALGPNGPFGGICFLVARKVIPSFDMIRQPARVYCLLPTLLAVGAVLGIGFIGAFTKAHRSRLSVGICLVLIVVAEFAVQVRATVCVLDRQQGAYAAAAEHADARGEVPRAIAVPLWPGDSDLGSLYQYYSSLYRIRMVNGYSPVVSRAYFEDTFRRFESINQGFLTDDQIHDLLERGIRYVLVHENAFPEKVSPFPVGTTLARLIDHPLVHLLHQDQSVWAFELRSESTSEPASHEPFYTYFPTRFYECERSDGLRVEKHEDVDASGGRYITLRGDGSWIATRPARTGDAPRLRWEIRLRGEGVLRVVTRAGGVVIGEDSISVERADWHWRSAQLPAVEAFSPLMLELHWMGGKVDADLAYLAAGPWDVPEPGREYRIPATAFFHAGYSDPVTGEVTIRAEYDPDGAILYGPGLPLRPGTYNLALIFSSPAKAGEVLGRIEAGADPDAGFDVVAGEPASGDVEVSSNLPFRADFVFSRAADIRVKEMIVTRVR